MKKQIIVSLLVILLSGTVIAGATMAWFTDSADPITNEFKAGTVEISAQETIEPEVFMQENWNPGNVAQKEYTIINVGTKGIFLRAVITGQWYEPDGETIFVPDPDENVVSWSFHDSQPTQNWVQDGDYWYYLDPIAGKYTTEDDQDRTVTLNLKVALDGPTTGNQYQGKVFKLTAVFESVQASNGAVHEVWANNPY